MTSDGLRKMLKKQRTFEKNVYPINKPKLRKHQKTFFLDGPPPCVNIYHFLCIGPGGPSQRAILGTQRSWQAVAASGVELQTLKLAVMAQDGPNEMPVRYKKTYGNDAPLHYHRNSACRPAHMSVPHSFSKKTEGNRYSILYKKRKRSTALVHSGRRSTTQMEQLAGWSQKASDVHPTS